jgi:hypothetical protein
MGLISLEEARKRIGISKVGMSNAIKRGEFQVQIDPVDRRKRLVDEEEIERFIRTRKYKPQKTRKTDGNSEGR